MHRPPPLPQPLHKPLSTSPFPEAPSRPLSFDIPFHSPCPQPDHHAVLGACMQAAASSSVRCTRSSSAARAATAVDCPRVHAQLPRASFTHPRPCSALAIVCHVYATGGHCSDRFCPSTSRLGSGNWGYPGDGCGGTWRVSDFGIFLRRQARWQVQNRRLQYNEIIINGDATRANMPAALDAFFYTGSDSGQARSQRALFLREFGDEVAGGIPLVRLDTSNWHMPFSRGH